MGMGEWFSPHYYPQVVIERKDASIIFLELAQSCQAWLHVSYTSPFSSPSFLSPLSLYKKDPPRFFINKEASENEQRGKLAVQLIPSPCCHRWSFRVKAAQD